MKTILASETMDIPEGVTVTVAAKLVTVEGPRGKLTRNFKHLNLDFQLQEGGRKLKVDAWFGTRRTMAAIRTAISHVQNLIKGVTKGYRYKMRFVYAHFPINASITNSNTAIEIRNFLGEKKVHPTHISLFRACVEADQIWEVAMCSDLCLSDCLVVIPGSIRSERWTCLTA
ncbi:60S ribosomal protein L9-1 [Zea mays]|jgi:large subunit ribosomal protein L9e|uniref:60S ribosomal protein L9-1 n=1 Tax=Zea mays TaxID=4577 RepID=A0A1D6LJJ0_MAIZE|nr:60S ribosomal protein L9-1 [Zea mays]